MTLVALAAGMPFAPSHAVITGVRESCCVRGCTCTHGPEHAADCPCCAARGRKAAGAGATVGSCHCGLGGEPATATPAQTEAVLAIAPSPRPAVVTMAVVAPVTDRTAGTVADPPEPVPRSLLALG